MQQRNFHSAITFNALWLNQQNDPRPICVMAQGPGAPSPLAASEVFLQEPSAQLLPLWLPASPWLPAEKPLHSLLGGKTFLLIKLKCLLTWAKKSERKKYREPDLPKSCFLSTIPQAPWLIWLSKFLSLEKFEIKSLSSWVKGQMTVVSCCTSLPTCTGVPDYAGHFFFSSLIVDSLQELMEWPKLFPCPPTSPIHSRVSILGG